MDSGFHLAKWYCDCITESGDVCIAYAAVVRWKKITVHYTAVMHGGIDNVVNTSVSLRSSVAPSLLGDTIHWSCIDLDAEGIWKRAFDAVERTLLDTEHGSIRWSCFMQGAEANMRVGKVRFQGLGYVEFLEMTLPPWKLPIEELRWGRFVSPTDALVWIDWQGIHPLRIAFHNGREIDCGTADESVISSRDNVLRLRLDPSTVIRSGPIIKTVLKKIPGINLLIPPNMLHTEETKWLSRGTLYNGAHQSSTGFALHEIVRFK